MASPAQRPHSAPHISFDNPTQGKKIERCIRCTHVLTDKAFCEVYEVNSDTPVVLCSLECYRKFYNYLQETVSKKTPHVAFKVDNFFKGANGTKALDKK